MNRYSTSLLYYVLTAWLPVFTVVKPTQPNELCKGIKLKIPVFIHPFFQRLFPHGSSNSHSDNNSLYQLTTTVYASFKNYNCHSRDTHVFD
jgi:hypothetical protein